MDFQPNIQSQQMPRQSQNTNSMALASLILGLLSVFTCGCIYLGMLCASLGIIFALLSRGGSFRMNDHAKVGLACSIIGLICTLVFFILLFVYVINFYGGIDGFMEEYMRMLGVESMEELYQSMGLY